jgi:uncharacterized protein YerC
MPQISKYPVSDAVGERIFGIFIKTLITIKDQRDAEDLISDLFSPTEKTMFAKRIAIALLLLNGYEYREISIILKVSLGTIASVNYSLKAGKGSYKKILKRIVQEENLEDFFQSLSTSLLSLPAGMTKGSSLWKKLHTETKSPKHPF